MAMRAAAVAVACVLALACAGRLTSPLESQPDEREEWTASKNRPGPRLSSLSANPKLFDPTNGPLEVRFQLHADADVRVVITNDRGVTIDRIELGRRRPGEVSARWEAGPGVRSGLYHYVVRARGADGAVSELGDDATFTPEEVMVQRFELDRSTGKVSYVLPKAARVRLRSGLAGNLVVGSLLDWQPQGGGRHELTWDGADASGLMDLRADPRLRLHLDAFRLPPNTVILERPGDHAGRGSAVPSETGYTHARHDPLYCQALRFSVDFPTAEPEEERGLPVLDGSETVRVTLDPQIAGHLIDTRFEVLFFVDTTFLFEEEDGSTPLNYTLDATRLAPGPHLLTVNVLSSDDHAGVITVPFLRR